MRNSEFGLGDGLPQSSPAVLQTADESSYLGLRHFFDTLRAADEQPGIGKDQSPRVKVRRQVLSGRSVVRKPTAQSIQPSP